MKEDDKFDLIMLSNIYDYTRTWDNNICNFSVCKQKFKTAIEKLLPHLNKDGQIQIEYVWSDIYSKVSILSHTLNLKNIYAIENSHMDTGSIMYAPDGIKNSEAPEM